MAVRDETMDAFDAFSLELEEQEQERRRQEQEERKKEQDESTARVMKLVACRMGVNDWEGKVSPTEGKIEGSGKAEGSVDGEEYQFPSREELEPLLSKLSAIPTQKLLQAVKNKEKSDDSGSYLTQRNKYCALNWLLNENGIIAPSFRPFRTFDYSKRNDPEEVLLGRDRQLIDLHYQYCQNKENITPLDDEFEALMVGDTFDMELASKLVMKEWTAGHKATEVLGLSEPQMYEMAVLRTKSIGDRLRSIKHKSKQVRRDLVNLASNPRSRLNLSDITSRVEEFVCLSLAKGSQVDAAKFWLLRGNGCDQDVTASSLSSVMGKRKKWFAERLNLAIK